MEYSSLGNHLYQSLHYIFAFFVLFIAYPRIIFKNNHETLLENIFSNYIRMVFIIIVTIYVLVILKIYEFIGILIIFILIYLYKSLKSNSTDTEDTITKMNVIVLDYVEENSDIKAATKSIRNILKVQFKNRIKYIAKIKGQIVTYSIITIAFLYAAYIRFYDVYKSAAPPMSDSYVVIAWMEYISQRILFHDGIYPQGSHMYLSLIKKFAFIDDIYIIKYTGPLNTMLILVGMYFLISRITGRKIPGVIAVIVYGVLGQFIMPGDWERQASINSQEFGFVFIYITIYFYYKYIKNGEDKDLITAFAGLSAVGLINAIAFAFTVFGVGILIASAFLKNFRAYKIPIFKSILSGILSAVIAVIPIGIGIIMGRDFHGSSAEFLTEKIYNVQVPHLKVFDYIGISSIAIIFIFLIINLKKNDIMDLFLFIFGGFSFALFYLGGTITQNVVVETRVSTIWSLAIPIVIGKAFFIIMSIFKHDKIRKILESSICIALIMVSIFYFKPQPIIPYKMERESGVQQYLKIKNMLRPTEWMIVSQNEGYALVLGSGWHMMMEDFLNDYYPDRTKLINKKTNTEYKMKDIFIYHEKEIFTADFESQPEIYETLKKIYDQREKDKINMGKWIDKYMSTHSNMTVFYEDDELKIMRIHNDYEREETLKRIWEESK